METNAAPDPDSKRPKEPKYLADPYVAICAALVLVASVTFAVWSGTAQLAQGVTAGGVLIAKDRRRSVQHLEGGIIQDLQITEGKTVRAGDLAMIITDATSNARLSQARTSRFGLLAALDRFEAQIRNAPQIVFSRLQKAGVDDATKQSLMDLNIAIFRDQLAAQNGERDLVAARIERLKAEADAIDVRRIGKQREVDTVQEEQTVQSEALAQRIGNISRFNEVTRTLVVIETELASLDEDERVIGQSIREAELELLEIDLRFRALISSEREKAANELTAVTDQLNALEDQQLRSSVVVPVNGVVIDLDFTSNGGVVSPGARLFDVVPSEAVFQIEARFQPQDRDDLVQGHEVNLRFGTLVPVNPPQITGVLSNIAADATLDQATNTFYYLATVDIPRAELDQLSQYIISSGIPVEVFFDKGVPRTPLSYFIEPIAEMLWLGMRS
jgi:HlyD family type I secretion membrane fusion protein